MSMDQAQASPGVCCWNEDCPDYRVVGRGNVRRFGRTRRGAQRYQCKTCGSTFTDTRGSLFYDCHADPLLILECLALVAERNSLAAISQVKGIKEDTVLAWLRKAGSHVEETEALLSSYYHLTRAQLDTLWERIRAKGEKRSRNGKRLHAPASPTSADQAA